MQEVWKDIEGYEDLYMISNYGNVKSLEKKDSLGRIRSEKILKLQKTAWGYFQLTLHKDNKKKNFLIHRLVAMAFIENPNNHLEVNHKDEDKTNNKVENLEWCDRTYNANFGTIKERLAEHSRRRIGENHPMHGRIGVKSPRYGTTGEKSPVARRIICETTGEIFITIREASRKMNINESNICDCCRGGRKTAGKHPTTKEKLVWRYYNGETMEERR